MKCKKIIAKVVAVALTCLPFCCFVGSVQAGAGFSSCVNPEPLTDEDGFLEFDDPIEASVFLREKQERFASARSNCGKSFCEIMDNAKKYKIILHGDIPAKLFGDIEYEFYDSPSRQGSGDAFLMHDPRFQGHSKYFYSPTLNLEEIVLVDTKVIGDEAFYDCESLIRCNLPEGLRIIGMHAFHYTRYANDLSAVVFPEGIEDIGTFYSDCCECGGNLSPQVVLPGSLKLIRECAFEEFTNLTQIVLPDGITSIGNCAFKTTGITEIDIPGSVKNLSGETIFNCAMNLKTVRLLPGIQEIGRYVFGSKESIHNDIPIFDLEIPDSVCTMNEKFWEDGTTSPMCPIRSIKWHGRTFSNVGQFLSAFEAVKSNKVIRYKKPVPVVTTAKPKNFTAHIITYAQGTYRVMCQKPGRDGRTEYSCIERALSAGADLSRIAYFDKIYSVSEMQNYISCHKSKFKPSAYLYDKGH